MNNVSGDRIVQAVVFANDETGTFREVAAAGAPPSTTGAVSLVLPVTILHSASEVCVIAESLLDPGDALRGDLTNCLTDHPTGVAITIPVPPAPAS